MTTLSDESGELRFPEDISFRATGGPSFNTTVVVSGSGKEQRTRNWLKERLKWDVAHAARLPEQYGRLASFFRLAAGKANDFRYKDWSDYQADFTNGVVGLGVGTGEPTLQLGKIYTFAGASSVRPIFKPTQDGTLAVRKNGTLLTEGSSAGNFEVDLSNGRIVFTTTVTKNITGISQAASAVVTSAAHGFTNGQIVWLTGIGGMVDMNFRAVTVSSKTTDTFATGIDTSASDAYTSGGTIKFYPQPSDVLTASFQFDVAVRFDTDEMVGEIADKSGRSLVMNWNSIPIIEVRTR